jgi:hypothetical protein
MIPFCKSGSHNAPFRAISGKAVGDLCINFISSQYTLASPSKVAGTSQYHLLRPHFDCTLFCHSPFGTAFTIPPMESHELWQLSAVCRHVKIVGSVNDLQYDWRQSIPTRIGSIPQITGIGAEVLSPHMQFPCSFARVIKCLGERLLRWKPTLSLNITIPVVSKAVSACW